MRLPTDAGATGAVTKEQWGTLVDVDKAGPAGLAMGELAVRRGMAINSATALVDRLVHAGLLERRHDLADRRVVRVAATAEGSRLRQAIAARRRERAERLLGALTPDELERLRASLPVLERLAELAVRGS